MGISGGKFKDLRLWPFCFVFNSLIDATTFGILKFNPVKRVCRAFWLSWRHYREAQE